MPLPTELKASLERIFEGFAVSFNPGEGNYYIQDTHPFLLKEVAKKLADGAFGIKVTGKEGKEKYVANHLGGEEFQIIITTDQAEQIWLKDAAIKRHADGLNPDARLDISRGRIERELLSNIFEGFEVETVTEKDGTTNQYVKSKHQEPLEKLSCMLKEGPGITGSGGRAKRIDNYLNNRSVQIILTPGNIKTLCQHLRENSGADFSLTPARQSPLPSSGRFDHHPSQPVTPTYGGSYNPGGKHGLSQ